MPHLLIMERHNHTAIQYFNQGSIRFIYPNAYHLDSLAFSMVAQSPLFYEACRVYTLRIGRENKTITCQYMNQKTTMQL